MLLNRVVRMKEVKINVSQTPPVFLKVSHHQSQHQHTQMRLMETSQGQFVYQFNIIIIFNNVSSARRMTRRGEAGI